MNLFLLLLLIKNKTIHLSFEAGYLSPMVSIWYRYRGITFWYRTEAKIMVSSHPYWAECEITKKKDSYFNYNY